MENKENEITVSVDIHAPAIKVWNMYNDPEHITKWAFASPDWESLYAENDVRVGGKFLTRMSAKDKSMSFDFTGEYTEVAPEKLIKYIMSDGRKASVEFIEGESACCVVVTFEMENENSREMQKRGWQAILDNFKKYVEVGE